MLRNQLNLWLQKINAHFFREKKKTHFKVKFMNKAFWPKLKLKKKKLN